MRAWLEQEATQNTLWFEVTTEINIDDDVEYVSERVRMALDARDHRRIMEASVKEGFTGLRKVRQMLAAHGISDKSYDVRVCEKERRVICSVGVPVRLPRMAAA